MCSEYDRAQNWKDGYMQGYREGNPKTPEGVWIRATCPRCHREFHLDFAPDQNLVEIVKHVQAHGDCFGYWNMMLTVYLPSL